MSMWERVGLFGPLLLVVGIVIVIGLVMWHKGEL